MNADNELTKYIRSMTSDIQGQLGILHREAIAEGLPVIPPETAAFLTCVLEMQKPVNALEIGCCVGFSAALIAERLAPEGRVTTIDRYDYMIARARGNFARLGLGDKITLLEGGAGEILPLLTGSYDFIFIDAAKGQYLDFLRHCSRLLAKGGVMIFDDIFQEGRIAVDKLSVPRRQRTIYTRMNRFLRVLTNSNGLLVSILPLGDGLVYCIKTDDTIILGEEDD